ncbi:MAG: UDP-N-acetylglucosamine 1-carboxyvinyltransferase [Candidatus Omnitrophica bacterium]|nr:UDP-N-acetylglucosamine 1-carboxyvinyltransferase [Candidatus Omnitrophota bacterium]MBU4478789.1 UDP-N-acetylglucosamine 1-carboxyvinyltransferase [Candidatus Omnitrophota bacterium]MCG2703678.1 UDP-N-acetylglucosamine 1-carboxyvinyltransferase [Candidatus Omnitrophota bacterium]
MDKIVIEGGVPLKGTVEVSGAKNAALPIIAATLLTDEKCVIKNVPMLRDVATMLKILRGLGVKAQMEENRVVVEPLRYKQCTADYKLVSTMRASICVLGPLLAKQKLARVSMPGGCIIGQRPVDLHIKGLQALGARIKIEHGYIVAAAKQLRGGNVFLGGAYGSSVLATSNVMMAAVLARGRTIIENAACEPEMVDLANFLIKMGAKIKGQGTPLIEVEGVKYLHGAVHSVIPDRIEAGTYVLAAAITDGDLIIERARIEHLSALIDKLQQVGISIKAQKGAGIHVKRRARLLKPVDITTLPYPGFPTDMQAQMMALAAVSDGISVITEKIFPDRFMHVSELNRMGANIFLEGASAIVKGVKRLSGAPVMASDLRASAALVLAGLVAKGKTEVSRIYHLDRGYEKLEQKLEKVGAKIKRVKE